ncbi:leucyl/phenylalanyl-tRNA--protein transferase [Phaeobacter italicus]|nr:leucyl/phenylalanyl-tRNA--protein transferase [Phaeobacter italicus]MEE2817983.1 leucyl/phenylalanyl-tRNA--protein transferase [Pseudomonadota bacterium]NKX70516.1 leucyl/phenylalanyl-tRNA--protein transferase [Rhodobacteraceae bacterium R_SAG1]MBO9440609.1 leucyl/phenylalanyl-tRNA--protein transferase [Phaeobacter italicus]MBY5975357.1 leucyl/phenylalanyl-tRNA--protein transferase [Phaeobacter italicus]MBY6042940.1 leucyl/phenylalanyl-tRNA--protein transferase [Phaeobacter italicus]
MTLTPDLLLHAYSVGVFPMAESRDDPEVFWVDPKRRGVFPIGGFRLSRSLAKTIRKGDYEVRVNHDFAAVVDGCADREETWINPEIRDRYIDLHEQGNAHSVEIYHDGDLSGGVYGVSLAGAFFGESMFSRRRDASKIALAYLLDRLEISGFTLCDTQFLTAHLASLGAVEISRASYRRQLASALEVEADFTAAAVPSPQALVQRMTQIS